MSIRRTRRSALLPGLALFMAACIGSIGDDEEGSIPSFETPPSASEAGTWTTRRLTKEQYAFTVEDVLGLKLTETQLDLLPAAKAAPGLPLNASHPTWGGTAIEEDGKWHLFAGGKYLEAGQDAPDPFQTWGRQPAYDASAADGGWGAFGGAYPWDFTTQTDPYADDR